MEGNKKLCQAIKKENYDEVEECLKQGVDLLAVIDLDTFFTPWTWLYSCNSYFIVSAILERYPQIANFPIPELCDQTLLYGAILHQNPSKIRLLVEKGADIDTINENGYTPLYYTIEQTKEVQDMIPLLLKLGADVTIGLGKFKKFKDKNLESFYKHVSDFLTRLQNTWDIKGLDVQTKRLLKMHAVRKLPSKLLTQVNELRKSNRLDFELKEDEEEEKRTILSIKF